MKINYHNAIKALIEFKDRHTLISNPKNVAILDYLHFFEVDPEDEDDEYVPDISKITKSLNMPRNKVYPIIYKAYMDLVETFQNTPYRVDNYLCDIYIFTQGDYAKSKNKQFEEEEKLKYLWGEFVLPVIPRLGESIEIAFIERDYKYNRGIVTEIFHEIHPTSQKIVIYVHPYKNYYYQWEKLKSEHLNHERWLKRIANENI